MKKMKSILATVASLAMFFTTIGSFRAFAENIIVEEREAFLAQLTPEQCDVLMEYWEETGSYKTGLYDLPSAELYPEMPALSEEEKALWDMLASCDKSDLLIEHNLYTIPYSFEEFLAMSDEEFLALEDVPDSVKKCYKEIRHYENENVAYVLFEFNDTVDFGMPGSLVAEKQEELCEFLNIPHEMIYHLQYHKNSCEIERYSIEINEDGYNGYSKEYVQNKLEAYLHFHKTICYTQTELLIGKLDPPPGDLNQDGEIGVTDVITLQKWLLGSGKLENWQSADIHEDGMINIYDLLLLKQMLIEQ